MPNKFLTTVTRPLLAASVLALTMAAQPAGVTAQDSNLQGDIRFSWWGGQVRNDKTDRIIQLFEQQNPGVTVARETADFAPYWERLTIQSAGNNQPCAITMQTRYLATYATPDILRPLDDLVESGVLDTTGIAEPVLNSARGADGNLYMIPHGVFYFALMYNEQIYENALAAGAPALEWPYTWDEYAEHLRAVQASLTDGVATHNMGREPDAFVTWVQSHGEDLFDGNTVTFTRETAIAWFNYWEALRNEGVTESPEEMVTENSALVEESNLANGRGYATNRPPNQLGSVQTVTNTVNPGATINTRPYPVGPDGTVGMDLGANGIAIGANCPEDQIPATAAFINYWTQDSEAAGIYQSDNGVVAIEALQNEQASNPETQPTQVRLIELFQQVASTADPVFWPAGGYGALTDTLNRAYDGVAFGQLSPEDAADQLIAELQDQITRAARQ
ncbi:ABC transporter substrate-binding protein [Devosia sp. Naph2]|uniref:ABC transporter substrate-binding protein n=1 Tax=Devosia polycyclovorans TaxID=3345148 RepID=UPI0035CF83B8